MNSNELTLLPQLFIAFPSVLYWKIDYQIENTRLTTGLASLIFTINQLPQSGSCSISPNNGMSLLTLFQITCSNWQDLDGTIVRYEYFGK